MDAQPNGELIPQGGGDAVPLTRSPLTLGRRESCDICLPFPTLSGKHCELTFKEGHWIVRDLDSTNGTSVNDMPVQKKVLHSGDTISFGSRQFTLQYTESGRLANLGEFEEEMEEIMSMSLLEKAGLSKPRRHSANPTLTAEEADEDFEESDDQPPAEPEPAVPSEPQTPIPSEATDSPPPAQAPPANP